MWNHQVAHCRANSGCRRLLTLSIFLMPLFLSVVPALSQTRVLNAGSAGDRKVVLRVKPDYPQTLKQLYIGGIVRVEVLVAPSGLVEKTTLLGGNPVLGQSAMKAVKQWHYAPGRSAETLTVTFEFDPHI